MKLKLTIFLVTMMLGGISVRAEEAAHEGDRDEAVSSERQEKTADELSKDLSKKKAKCYLGRPSNPIPTPIDGPQGDPKVATDDAWRDSPRLASCKSCHVAGGKAGGPIKDAARAAERVKDGSMPPNSTLTDTEKSDLSGWIKSAAGV